MSLNKKLLKNWRFPARTAVGVAALIAISAPAATATEPASLRAALAHCGDIEDNDARLACVDVILEALNQADAVRAEAQAARRDAETARKEAEAARSEAQARIAEAEARRAEAEARMREAEMQLRQSEVERAELARTAQESDAEARARELHEREHAATQTLAPRGGRIPESTPVLFGAVDLTDEAAARLLQGIDLNAAYQAEELDRIRASVSNYGYNNAKKAYVVLKDGQVWRQQGGSRVRFTSKGPQSVEIIRGALNSFTMRMDDRGRYFKVERVK